MVSTRVARRYAAAVAQVVGPDQGALAGVGEELHLVAAVLAASPELRRALTHRGLPREGQAAVLAEIFGPRVGPVTAGLLRVVALKSRIAHLGAIAEAVTDIIQREQGVVPVEVVSATALDGGQRAALERALAQTAGPNLRLRWGQDPGLIAGLIIRGRGWVIDAGVRGRLARLARSLSTLPE